MSDVPLPTQDGGKSGKLKVETLSMRRVRCLRFKTKASTLMLRTEIFKLSLEERMRSDNNLKLFMSTNTRSQRKENLTINSVFMSKEISTLSQPYQVEDTSI
jgi:hypothetical protein